MISSIGQAVCNSAKCARFNGLPVVTAAVSYHIKKYGYDIAGCAKYELDIRVIRCTCTIWI